MHLVTSVDAYGGASWNTLGTVSTSRFDGSVAFDSARGVAVIWSLADFSTSVPNRAELLGVRLFAQGIHTASGANPAGLLVSDAQALVAGR